MSLLTGDYKKDLEILDTLNDEDLQKIFLVNDKYNSNQFWDRRLEIKFPGSFKFKGFMTSFEFYKKLSAIDFPSTMETKINLILNNDLNVLQYLYDKETFVIDIVMANAAASIGNIEIIDWMGKLPDQDGINSAAKNGNFEFVIYMHETHNLLPNIFSAALSNDIKMVEYTLQMRDTLESVSMSDTLKGAFIDLEIIEFVSEEILLVLFNNGYNIQKIAMEIAAKYGRLNIMKLLKEEKNIQPDEKVIKIANMNGYYQIVGWCNDNGIF